MEKKISSTFFSSDFGVRRLTTGTTTSPNSMEKAPATIEDEKKFRYILATVIPTPQMKAAHTAAFVVRFQNSPYRKGARHLPGLPRKSP